MKVLVNRGVIASGQALDAGQTYDVSEVDGALLIRMGKAVEVTAAPACPPTPPKAKTATAPKKAKEKVDGTE